MRKKVGIISLVLIILFTSACSKDNTEGKVEEVSYQETTEKTNYIKIEMQIVENFMIQGGDPEGTGRGGSDETIKGEFLNNGVTNTISHERGVISMARNGVDMNSASSQFFICHADVPSLDGDYAAFGKLIAGFNTLDKLAKTAVNGETPINPPKIKSIRFINIEIKIR